MNPEILKSAVELLTEIVLPFVGVIALIVTAFGVLIGFFGGMASL